MKTKQQPREVEVQICKVGVPSGFAVNIKVNGRAAEFVMFPSMKAAMLGAVEIANEWRRGERS